MCLSIALASPHDVLACEQAARAAETAENGPCATHDGPTCHCGKAMDEHTLADGHDPVPMPLEPTE